MNITEFAEQIVFGTTLAEKLASPGRLSPDSGASQRKAFETIPAPGRPDGLIMQSPGNSNLTRPRDDNLENEAERGKLLHFLANHELLATELMALVLLKFPDAPHAFRRGVLVTLQEEQAHTQMYIDRMRECGVEFGTYPVSGQFWRIVEPMRSPMDFVSRLSLTFEQANLDYSLHFAKVFSRIGDDATASVLQQIYEDEIGHVQHGLHWFRQWKEPDKSDWAAYEATLDFPMSPQRARAPKATFNRVGRQRAGLDNSFIDSVEVFQQSRGRATTVRWFDAGAENELSNSQSTKTNTLIDRLNSDLQLVLLPLAKPDDILLVQRLPSETLRKQLVDAKFELPEFVLKNDRQNVQDRKLHNCAPWAWTPNNHTIATEFHSAMKHRQPPWLATTEDLFRKSWGNQVLSESLKSRRQKTNASHDFFCDESVLGTVIQSVEEFIAARNDFRERGFSNVIFKPDLSASGRGQRRFATSGELTDHDQVWLNSALSRDPPDYAVVEPELDRVLDFSMLWHASTGSEPPVYQGWSHQLIGDGRRYLGSQLDKSLSDCDSDVRRFVLEKKCERVRQTATWVCQQIASTLVQSNFSGPLGVDAFVFRDFEDQLKIKPIVELNPRHTMGHVSLALAKRIANGVTGQFRIFTKPQWQAVEDRVGKYELEISNQGQWKSGFIPLGQVGPQTKMIPAVLVGKLVCETLQDVGLNSPCV